jgi:hypothetical protein
MRRFVVAANRNGGQVETHRTYELHVGDRGGSISFDLFPDHFQLGYWFVVGKFGFAGVAIPVKTIAAVALDLVQHRMDPTGRAVRIVLLDNAMGSIPLIVQSQVDCSQEFGIHTISRMFYSRSLSAPNSAPASISDFQEIFPAPNS